MKDAAARLYSCMRTIRKAEEKLLELFSQGKLRGTTHTCLGQEACAAAVALALDPSRDTVISNHRGHGHYLAHTGDLEGLLNEVLGKDGGPSRGIGGSQHLFRERFMSNGILGGTVALACGVAMAEKLKKNGAVTAVFLGDGALGEGVVYEAFNIASLWSLPLLFAIECNQFAQSTPIEMEIAGKAANRPRAFGIETREAADSEPLKLLEQARRCVEAVRRSGKPQALVLQTYRLGPHSKGDDNRDPKELARRWKKDPLARLAKKLNFRKRQELEQAVEERLAKALAQAESREPMPWKNFEENFLWKG